MKQGEEATEFVKEPHKEKQGYIFQKNTKTKIGFKVVLAFLILLIIGVAVSLYFFVTPA
ncbi:hypothetical protein [Allomuricauda sp. d1]|uniref:hypothetical protein n=1 Tax=Allomuricauda sp. d1 TaxID=3136725 RepID=UPI0031DB8156